MEVKSLVKISINLLADHFKAVRQEICQLILSILTKKMPIQPITDEMFSAENP